MVTSVPDPVINALFPQAHADGYALTSDEDDYYNCIAWAAGVIDIPWWPLNPQPPEVYWPPGIPAEHTLAAFMEAYQTRGYKGCGTNGRLQHRYEKIAIYVDRNGKPTHSARQLAN